MNPPRKTRNIIYLCDLSYTEGVTPLVTPFPECPNSAAHTKSPAGYIAWHEWARQMMRTHRQELCTGCNRWMIWIPRKRASQRAPQRTMPPSQRRGRKRVTT